MNSHSSEDHCNEIILLESGNELRFIIQEPGKKVVIQLVEGTAELFGSELQRYEDYEFSYFSSVTIYTWHGCTFKLNKRASNHHKSEIKISKTLPIIRDVHDYLEDFRMNAEKNKGNCPITLITGPTDVGKSTLCRFLLNYAARHGKKPVFIDLDVGQSSLSITGTFGVLPINKPSDENGKFDEQELSVYYFGYKSPGHHMLLYKLLLEKLGNAVKVRLKQSSNNSSSGIIIDTCGWIDGGGYKLILKIVSTFEVNTVLVIGKKPLYNRLIDELPEETNIKYIPELEGVVTRNGSVRKDSRNSHVYEYFYGLSKSIQPHVIEVRFCDLEIYKANTSLCHVSVGRKNSNVIAIPIEPSILYQVFGLSYAENVEDIPLTSIFGFVCIIKLDMDSKIAVMLSPQAAPLPTKYLLMGDIVIPNEMISY